MQSANILVLFRSIHFVSFVRDLDQYPASLLISSCFSWNSPQPICTSHSLVLTYNALLLKLALGWVMRQLSPKGFFNAFCSPLFKGPYSFGCFSWSLQLSGAAIRAKLWTNRLKMLQCHENERFSVTLPDSFTCFIVSVVCWASSNLRGRVPCPRRSNVLVMKRLFLNFNVTLPPAVVWSPASHRRYVFPASWRILQYHTGILKLFAILPVLIMHPCYIWMCLDHFWVQTSLVWIDISRSGMSRRFFLALIVNIYLPIPVVGIHKWKRQWIIQEGRYTHPFEDWDMNLSELMPLMVCTQHRNESYRPFSRQTRLVKPI